MMGSAPPIPIQAPWRFRDLAVGNGFIAAVTDEGRLAVQLFPEVLPVFNFEPPVESRAIVTRTDPRSAVICLTDTQGLLTCSGPSLFPLPKRVPVTQVCLDQAGALVL